MNEAINFLTGAPSATYINSDTTTINSIGVNAWTLINATASSKFILTAVIGATGCDSASNDKYHLPCNHAYSIIGAYAITNSAGTITNRLLSVRNPWGVDAGYNGTWNDQDTNSWTSAA